MHTYYKKGEKGVKYIVRAVAICDFPSGSQMEVVLAEGILDSESVDKIRSHIQVYMDDLIHYANEMLGEYATLQYDIEPLDGFIARLKGAFSLDGPFSTLGRKDEEEGE